MEKLPWPRAPRASFATILKILCVRIRAMRTLPVEGREAKGKLKVSHVTVHAILVVQCLPFIFGHCLHDTVDDTHEGAER